MNRKKLSPEEIRVIRVDAEKKRQEHRVVMANLCLVTMSPQLQMTTLMSSYNRGREDEMLDFLRIYTSENRKYELDEAVKMFIYTHDNEFPKVRKFMLQNNHLGYEMEKRIFDDHLVPFFITEKGLISYPKFCPEAEVYVIKETLKKYQKAYTLNDELKFLKEYVMRHKLSSLAEVTLIDFLFITTSEWNALQAFVLGYLKRYQSIDADAQKRLIQSGDHEVILYYITHSLELISAPIVVDALLERADEEEVTAYFNRWARE